MTQLRFAALLAAGLGASALAPVPPVAAQAPTAVAGAQLEAVAFRGRHGVRRHGFARRGFHGGFHAKKGFGHGFHSRTRVHGHIGVHKGFGHHGRFGHQKGFAHHKGFAHGVPHHHHKSVILLGDEGGLGVRKTAPTLRHKGFHGHRGFSREAVVTRY